MIKGKISTITRKIAINFGTKVRVCSEIEVAAWKIEIKSPTIRETRRIGPPIMRV